MSLREDVEGERVYGCKLLAEAERVGGAPLVAELKELAGDKSYSSAALHRALLKRGADISVWAVKVHRNGVCACRR